MKTQRILSMRRPFTQAFTLIELLIVIAIIALLAALSIGSFNLATKSAARNRTTATLQAITGALERYKADNGEYPEPTDTTTKLAPDNKFRVGGAMMLYQAITGDGNDKIKLDPQGGVTSSGTVAPANKQFIINGDFIPTESALGSGNWKSKLNSTMKTTEGFWLMDGFGHPFQYQRAAIPATPGAAVTATTVNPTYDLWSYGDVGGSDNTTDDSVTTKSNPAVTTIWIKNW